METPPPKSPYDVATELDKVPKVVASGTLGNGLYTITTFRTTGPMGYFEQTGSKAPFMITWTPSANTGLTYDWVQVVRHSRRPWHSPGMWQVYMYNDYQGLAGKRHRNPGIVSSGNSRGWHVDLDYAQWPNTAIWADQSNNSFKWPVTNQVSQSGSGTSSPPTPNILVDDPGTHNDYGRWEFYGGVLACDKSGKKSWVGWIQYEITIVNGVSMMSIRTTPFTTMPQPFQDALSQFQRAWGVESSGVPSVTRGGSNRSSPKF